MSLSGTLDDFSPVEVISVLGMLERSGKLRLTQDEDEGMVVFRRGKIIFAVSSGFRENLGTMLLARGLVNESQLVEALALQVASSEEKRLGAILIDMGALTQEALNDVILEQVIRTVSEFSDWSSGEFDFNTVHVADHGEVELQAEELWAPLGLSPNHVLLRLAQKLDESHREPSPPTPEAEPEQEPIPDVADAPEIAEATVQETGESATLKDFVGEVRGPQVKGELIQRLLEQASEIFGRSVLFSARHDGFRSIAQTGESLSKPADGAELLKIVLERDQPSILGSSTTAGSTVMARLPESLGDNQILEAIGGPVDGKSVAIPLLVRDEPVLVLYGDTLCDDLHNGWLEGLESFMDQTARSIEEDIQAEIAAEIAAATSA